jgi:hypothetical protein
VIIRICPLPRTWITVVKRLEAYAREHACEPRSPPDPLVLSGWTFSNDAEKAQRWEATVEWARRNGCDGLLADVPDSEFFALSIRVAYETGVSGEHTSPHGSPPLGVRPSVLIQAAWLGVLQRRWREIAGENLATGMRPLAFVGEAFRSLLVEADANLRPPWGTWTEIYPDQPSRRAFRTFRAAVNRAIAPHEVYHIEFRLSGAESNAP